MPRHGICGAAGPDTIAASEQRRRPPARAQDEAYKQQINTVWIYPTRAERAAAIAFADPEKVTNR